MELTLSDEGIVSGQFGSSSLSGEYREDALRLTIQGDPGGFLVLAPEPPAEPLLRLAGRLRLASGDAKKIYSADVTLTRDPSAGVRP